MRKCLKVQVFKSFCEVRRFYSHENTAMHFASAMGILLIKSLMIFTVVMFVKVNIQIRTSQINKLLSYFSSKSYLNVERYLKGPITNFKYLEIGFLPKKKPIELQ